MYAIGGRDGSLAALNTLEAYDPATNSWTTLTSMPTARMFAAAAVIGGVIYVVGGNDGLGGTLDTLEAYDPATDSWSSLSSMPPARYNLAASAYGGLLFAIGGSDTSDRAEVEAYDPGTDTWAAKSPLLAATEAPAASTVGTSIYVIGGESSGVVTGAVEVYDPIGDSWTASTPIPTPRAELAVCVYGSTIYCVGGETFIPGLFTNATEAFDTTSAAWTMKTAMPTVRDECGAAVVGQSIYVIGGGLNSTPVYDLNERGDFPYPSLNAAISVNPSTPGRCQAFQVAITLTNTGNVSLISPGLAGGGPRVEGAVMSLSGPVPPWPGTLAPGASATAVWSYLASAGTLVFSATGTATDSNSGSILNSPPLTTGARAVSGSPLPPSIALVVSTTRFSYSSGEGIVYSLDYSNTGGDTASNVTLWDSWTAGVAYVSSTGGGVVAGSLVHWSLPPVPPGGAGQVQYTLRAPVVPNGPFTCGQMDASWSDGTFTDTCGATYTAPTGFPTPIEYRNAVLSLAVQPSATTIAQGLPVTFTITAVNTCDDSAVNVQIWDTLPADLTYVGMPAVPGGGYTAGNRRVTFAPVTVARAGLTGSVYSVSFTASATGAGGAMCPETASASYTNEAAVAQPTALSASACVALLAPHLKVTVTGPPEAGTDATFTYSITVSNATGTATAFSVVLVDTVPGGLGFVTGTGSPALAGRILTWLLPDLPAGGSVSVTATMHGPGGEQELTIVDAAHATYRSAGGLVQQDDAEDHGSWTMPLQPVLVVRVFPTPFEPAAAIRGTLKFSGLNAGATVKIFTVSGALVRSLSGVVTHRLEWDGRDTGGAPAAAGIYFYLLSNPDPTGAVKVTKGTFGVIR